MSTAIFSVSRRQWRPQARPGDDEASESGLTALGIRSYFVLMPSPYRNKPYPLSKLVDQLVLVRVRCAYCKRTINYLPADLIQIFGDADVDSLMTKMKCEAGSHGSLDVDIISPTGKEAVGLKIRRLVAIKIQRVPVWKEEP